MRGNLTARGKQKRAEVYLDRELEQQEWFKYDMNESPKYRMLKNAGGHKPDFKQYFNEDLKAIYHLIDLFENKTSEQTEIVATLYASWDYLLKNKQLINETALLSEFYDWSAEKSRFKNQQVVEGLRWMESRGVVPIRTLVS